MAFSYFALEPPPKDRNRSELTCLPKDHQRSILALLMITTTNKWISKSNQLDMGVWHLHYRPLSLELVGGQGFRIGRTQIHNTQFMVILSIWSASQSVIVILSTSQVYLFTVNFSRYTPLSLFHIKLPQDTVGESVGQRIIDKISEEIALRCSQSNIYSSTFHQHHFFFQSSEQVDTYLVWGHCWKSINCANNRKRCPQLFETSL